MPKSRITIYTFKRETVRRKFVAELTEKQLRHILSGLQPKENVMDLNEDDFLDYPDGRGQICTRVELMGAKTEMRRLQEIVAKSAYVDKLFGHETEICLVDYGRSGQIIVDSVRTVP
jgi:hypothetical protein